jgi:fatty acid desaturase
MTKNNNQGRNYSINGPENQWAKEKGLAAAEWYVSPISRKRLKELMVRKDGPAIRDTLLWLGRLVFFGFLGVYTWGTWWAVPVFIIYGTLYSAAADARWHECQHGTAFRTPWMNKVVYQIASFLNLRPATTSYWSHIWHHTDTIIVGLDPEIVGRPPVWRILLSNLIRLHGGLLDQKRNLLHFFGKLNDAEMLYTPVSEHRKAFWEARITFLILLGVVISCFMTGSLLPAMLIGLPTFYGTVVFILLALPQHLGLSEDVLDHRLNTRTFHTNIIFRFIYWNMNYHIEHHMFPMVPYHALPALHKEVKDDYPPAYPNLWAALKEVYKAIQAQRKDVSYSYVPPLPATAQPYKFGPTLSQNP